MFDIYYSNYVLELIVLKQVLQMFKKYSGTFLIRWMMAKACLSELGDYIGSSKTFVWQFLDGKYDCIIV